jgi:hypothetical protein
VILILKSSLKAKDQAQAKQEAVVLDTQQVKSRTQTNEVALITSTEIYLDFGLLKDFTNDYIE